jgi:hypothetical protein
MADSPGIRISRPPRLTVRALRQEVVPLTTRNAPVLESAQPWKTPRLSGTPLSAYAPPPKAKNTATVAITFPYVSRCRITSRISSPIHR